MSPRGSMAAAVRLWVSTRRYEERPVAGGLYRKRDTPSGRPPRICFMASVAQPLCQGIRGATAATFWNRIAWQGDGPREGVLTGAVLTGCLSVGVHPGLFRIDVQLKAAHLLPERDPAGAEQRRRLGAVPSRLAKHSDQPFAFGILLGSQRRLEGAHVLDLAGQIAEVDLAPRGGHQAVLDRVAQLADVSGPGIVHQGADSLRGDAPARAGPSGADL